MDKILQELQIQVKSLSKQEYHDFLLELREELGLLIDASKYDLEYIREK